MAPRKQPKVGNRRIDAAIDTLGQFGFSPKEVSQSVHRLLKVYGGDDGWPFLEEASYQLVMDDIFEHRNEETKQKVNDKNESAEKDNGLSSDPRKEVQEEGDGAGILIDMGNTSVSLHLKRTPCYGWISDEDD